MLLLLRQLMFFVKTLQARTIEPTLIPPQVIETIQWKSGITFLNLKNGYPK